MKKEYHGNLLDVEFKDPKFLNKFKVFAKRKSNRNPWIMYGIVVSANKIKGVIKNVQKNLLSDKPYYAHFYREGELIVVFKKKVFRVTPDKSTWSEIIEYGRGLGIPDDQLVFAPNKLEEEESYYRDEKD